MAQEDFGANFLRGAQVGNMRAMQLERAQELASQDALRRIQERNLAQQIDQRAQLFQQAQDQDEQDKADIAAFGSLYNEQVSQRLTSAQLSAQETGDKVDPQKIAADTMGFMLPALGAKNPSAAKKVSLAVQSTLANQSREDVASERAGASEANAKTRAEAIKYSADQRLEATRQRLQEAGLGHEAATTFAQNVNTWRAKQSEAEESGDFQAAATYGQQIQDAYQFLDRTHPNATKTLHLKNLQATASAAYKAYLDTGMRNKKLKDEWERAQAELEKERGNEGDGGASTAPITPAPTGGSRFKVKVIKP